MAELKYRMWRKKDGTEIRIKDMDDQHLVNAIVACRRRSESLCKSSSSGFMDLEDMIYTEPEWFDPPALAHLVFEAQVRGIEI